MRLYPQTHTKPKAMVRLAGKPILGYILSGLASTRVDEIVVIVDGEMKEQIVEYSELAFGNEIEFWFVAQGSAEACATVSTRRRASPVGTRCSSYLGICCSVDRALTGYLSVSPSVFP